ncbi:MAG: hypothetical protein WC143_08650 [Eubacteriales bacterium]|jgi:hypothetical protein|nr:hypothetical protein [Clostridia bacterium]MDD3086216.1 hypothetical protein [Candidatus ainarchaeum sp.]
MNVSSTQKTAEEMSKFLKNRNNAKNGSVCIIYKNESGDTCTGYIDFMKIEVDINGEKITIKEMFEHFYKLEELVNEYKIKANESSTKATKALEIAQNMEKYMPNDYVGI